MGWIPSGWSGSGRRSPTRPAVPGHPQAPPAGFAPAGPAGRFLLHKALFVHHDEPADERVHTEAVLVTCMRHWSVLAPLHRWLTDNVQVP